jgi:hemolysin-activating ACP:hemolysin acyltransferase
MNPEQQKNYDLICTLRGQASEGISNYLQHALKISVTEGNFEIFYSEGKPIGYWAWANTVRESVSRLKRTGRYPFFAYEWNEGRITLIIDVCFIPSPNNYHAILKKSLSRKKLLAYKFKNHTVLRVNHKGFFRTLRC